VGVAGRAVQRTAERAANAAGKGARARARGGGGCSGRVRVHASPGRWASHDCFHLVSNIL